MEISVKFIVITPLNASWMRNTYVEQQQKTFTNPETLKQAKELNDTLFTEQNLIWGQNDFSKEMLMAFNQEEPISSLRLVSNRHDFPGELRKNMFVDMILHNFSDEGFKALLSRAEQIAVQRKYDVLWTEIFKDDNWALNVLEQHGFSEIGTSVKSASSPNMVILKKTVV